MCTMLKSMRKSKNRHFYPWGNRAKCCMDGKRIWCLQIVSQHVPIYLQQFPSYSNRKCKKSPFSSTAAHIFVSPGDTHATITQYVAWMERQLNACQKARSMYLSVFNSFRVIRCWSQCVSPKIAIFHHILVSPGDAPGAITLKMTSNRLKLNADKTQIIWIGTRQQLKKVVDADVVLNGHRNRSVANCHVSWGQHWPWADICVAHETSGRAMFLQTSPAADDQALAVSWQC